MTRVMARRLLSLAALMTLIVGVPALLISLHATPTVGQVTRVVMHPASWARSLGRPIDDDVAVMAVAIFAWATWSWLALCVGLELFAIARGIPAIRMPASRYGQSLAAFLVGASLAVPSTARAAQPLRLETVETTAATAFKAVHAPARVGLREYPMAVSESLASNGSWASGKGDLAETGRHGPIGEAKQDPLPAQQTASVQTVASPTYVVEAGDTLWSIASRELGSPFMWRQIADLNMGRLQPDGRELTDAHWIFPGWVLVLPTVPETAASEATSIAVLPSSSSSVPVASENPRNAPTMTSAPWPSASAPGLHTLIPTREPDTPATLRNLNGTATRISARHDHHVPIAPIGFGILGAAVIGVIDRMRRAQQRRRRPGLRIALPEADLRELETGLRLGADTEAHEWIDLAQRLLSWSWLRQTSNADPPRIIALRLDDNAIEVILDPHGSLSPPPEPFEMSSAGASWILPKTPHLLDALKGEPEVVGANVPVPGLVTIGRDERGLFLLDVERVGSLAIAGSEAGALAEAMAIEIACSKWSDQVDLVVVGLTEQVGTLERVTHAPNVASVVQKLERRVQQRAELLEIVQQATNSDTRWRDGSDIWDLCIVFCMPASVLAEPQAVEELIRLSADGSCGLAVVCASHMNDARVRVCVEGGPISFQSGLSVMAPVTESGIPVWPQRVEEGFSEGVASLINVAKRTEGVLPEEPPYDMLSTTGEEPVSIGAVLDSSSGHDGRPHRHLGHQNNAGELDWNPEVEVRILGPVAILGAAKEFARAWAEELVIYLAFHRHGASTEKWTAALWPDRLVAPASVHSTASSARRALGCSQSGEDHLPRSHGRLSLGPGVKTDWEQFEILSRSSQHDDSFRALELIRGRPFEGLRAPDWPVLEGITATIEAVVVDLACRSAEFCLSIGDTTSAEWAARVALKVSAFDERLYRILMRAADRAGNPSGVESVMAELTRLVSDEVEPFDAVHPETLDLYRELSRRPFARRTFR